MPWHQKMMAFTVIYIYTENLHLCQGIHLSIFKENHLPNKFCNWHGQSGWYFLILDLKASKQEYSFIFPGTKKEIGAKKEIVSVPYFTVLGTLLENPLCVLRLYDKDLLILKTSPIIAGKGHEYVYIFLLLESAYFGNFGNFKHLLANSLK